MIDRAALLSDLQRLLGTLEADLRKRSDEVPEIKADLVAQHAAALADKRTAEPYLEWREELITQVGVAWILGCVFVRFLEDNDFLDTPFLSGPGDRLQAAQDQHTLFVRAHPTASDREYLLHVFATVGRLPALERLYGDHNPLHVFGPSADGAQTLLRFWQEIPPATGVLAHDFTDPTADTRFVGDLYQDLSEAARKRYALLQTPIFVEEFILDRTLEPALQTFGLKATRMIDPTCGSGHFLLGAFARLFALWQKEEPTTPAIELVRRSLDAVHGIDLNPFAVAVARFRLLVAALRAAGIAKVRSAPAWPLHVFTGDALLFGPEPGQQVAGELLAAAVRGAYRTEDAEDATRVLSQRYHAVVGNPPYITVDDKVVKSAIKQRFKSCHGKWVLVVPFFERFFDLAVQGDGTEARRAGFVGKITGNNFMKREFGKKLVEDFIPKWDITHIIDTAGAYLPGHGTPTVIVFGRHQRPVAATIRAVMGIKGEPSTPTNPALGYVWRAITDQIDRPGSQSDYVSVADTARASFHSHPWSIGGGGASELKERLDEAAVQKLEAISDSIGITAFTLEDDIFLNPRKALERSGLPPASIRQLIEGDTVRDWRVGDNDCAVWPYDEDFTIRDLAGTDPLIRFLWIGRTGLANNKMFGGKTKVQAGLKWYEFGRLTDSKLRTPLTITFGEVATHNHFVLDRGGKVFKQTAPVIKLPASATEDDHLGLLGLLNSSTACFYLKQVCFPKGGDHQGSEGARVRTTLWDERYAFNSTQVSGLPLPSDRPLEYARDLDRYARELQATSPSALIEDASTLTEVGIDQAYARYHRILGRMIALQEELDWQVYFLYGLTAEPIVRGPSSIVLGQRAFEIALARKIAAGEEQSEWFNRHRATPLAEVPDTVGKEIVERRLRLIASDKAIGLIERPEYKRRWNLTPWDEQLKVALRTWLLDRLESFSHPQGAEPVLFTVHDLAERTRTDPDFQRVAGLYTGRADFDLTALVGDLVTAENVPSLPGQRYKESGLRKRLQWEETWEKQRAEDAITDRLTDQGLTGEALKQAIQTAVKKEIGEIPVPPKYTSADFYPGFWKLRGKLDVPKERWISYPGAERTVDPTLVVAWAGWNHLQQAQAVAAHYEVLRNDGASEAQLARLLASLSERLPWLRQWHNEIDPTYGERMGDFFTTFVEQEAQRLQLTKESLLEIARSRQQASPAAAGASAGEEDKVPVEAPKRLADFVALDLSILPKKHRAKTRSDETTWGLFVYHFLQHVPESATLPLLEETWNVLARRRDHEVEISNALGDEAYRLWEKSLTQEMPVAGFFPFVIDLCRDRWISVDKKTLKISLPAGSALLANKPDKWSEYDVALALKVVAQRVETRGSIPELTADEKPVRSPLVMQFEAMSAA